MVCHSTSQKEKGGTLAAKGDRGHAGSGEILALSVYKTQARGFSALSLAAHSEAYLEYLYPLN